MIVTETQSQLYNITIFGRQEEKYVLKNGARERDRGYKKTKLSVSVVDINRKCLH